MISLGRKDNIETIGTPSKSSKNKIRYPSCHISDVDLGIGEDDVGKELTAMVKVRITDAGKHINTNEDGTKKRDDYSLEILGIEFKGIKGDKPNSNWSVSDIMKHKREE